MLTLIFQLLSYLVQLAIWAIILSAVFSMLAAFNIIDTRNRLVWSIGDFLYRVTEPLLRPIRRIVPQMGSIDISPWIAVLILQFLVAPLLTHIYAALYTGSMQPLVF